MENDTQLARWLEGKMDPTEREAFEKSPNYPMYLQIRDNFDRLQKPQFDAGRILKDVLAHPKIQVKTVPLYKRGWLQAAAIAVVLLGLAIAMTIPTHKTAGNGKQYAFTLPDASEVILNAGSDASYTAWNWSSNRNIALNGEAYFKVAKGKKFEVKTQWGTVSVLGTKFNVKARENRFEVVCYEGKVRVVSQGKTVILTPNGRIAFANGKTEAEVITGTAEPQWLHSELAFNRESLPGVIAEIERQYDVRIKTAAVSAQLFSGSVPGNDLDAALKILSVTYHLNVSKTSDTIMLTPIEQAP